MGTWSVDPVSVHHAKGEVDPIVVDQRGNGSHTAGELAHLLEGLGGILFPHVFGYIVPLGVERARVGQIGGWAEVIDLPPARGRMSRMFDSCTAPVGAVMPLTLPAEKQYRNQRAPGCVARCSPAAYALRSSSLSRQ